MTLKELEKRSKELQKKRLLELKRKLKIDNEIFGDVFQGFKDTAKDVFGKTIEEYLVILAEIMVNNLKNHIEYGCEFKSRIKDLSIELMNIAELMYHLTEDSIIYEEVNKNE